MSGTIPPSLEWLPDDKKPSTGLKAFGIMLNKLWQQLFQALGSILGAATTYTPVVTASSGAFTSVSATGRYRQIGKLVFLQVTITITTNGTASGRVICSLPFAGVAVSGVYYIIPGRARGISGKMLQGEASNQLLIWNFDNTYPGADGEVLVVSGFYEAV